VSRGKTVSGDPEQWTIVDDKLNLNYNKKVLIIWRTDPTGFIKQGNQNWLVSLEESTRFL
jgi:hypothetical protein